MKFSCKKRTLFPSSNCKQLNSLFIIVVKTRITNTTNGLSHLILLPCGEPLAESGDGGESIITGIHTLISIISYIYLLTNYENFKFTLVQEKLLTKCFSKIGGRVGT